MAEHDGSDTAETPVRSKKPLIIGLVLMLVLGAASFFAVSRGLILGAGHDSGTAGHSTGTAAARADVAYVPVEPLVVSIGAPTLARHLRFAGQIEVARAHQDEVVRLMPRIVDMLNTFLRAVDPSAFEDQDALVRLRAQMLRRIRLVAGEDRVRDLLVSEYVIN